MKLLRRHKSVLIALGIYWPFLFWLTHIPVPDIARQSGLSDKTMHVLAYFVLVFLIWFAISPYEKVRWKSKKVWILLAVVLGYAALDEYVQSRVGRSMQFTDIVADAIGMLLALGVLSIFGFWSSLLTVSAVFVFVITNKSNFLLLYPEFYLNTVFHLTAYTAFALIWIQHAERYNPIQIGTAKWVLYAVSVPVGLLVLIMGTAPLFGRTAWWPDLATAIFGIVSAVIISGVTMHLARRKKGGDRRGNLV